MPHFTARDGAKLHYYDIGKGPLCIMLHGFGMASELWLPLVAPLLRKQRFVLLSQRGFGRSHRQSFNQNCIMTQLAEDLEDLLDALAIERCHLAGYSMGACASMHFLTQHPNDRIQAYLQIDQAACTGLNDSWSWGLFGDEHQQWMSKFADLLALVETVPREASYKSLSKPHKQAIAGAFSDFFEIAAHKQWLRYGSRALNSPRLASSLLPMSNWQAYMHCMKAYASYQYDFRPGLKTVSTPMWNFVGERSRMYPAEGQLKLSELVAGEVTDVHFPGCGHALPFESPRRFTQQLGRFLAVA